MSVVYEIDGKLYYLDVENNLHLYPSDSYPPAYPASEEDLDRDEVGFTDPNLHRRVDPRIPVDADDAQGNEIAPRNYNLQIHNLFSYRTTEKITHIDYQDLDKYRDSEYFDQILELFRQSERLEIP